MAVRMDRRAALKGLLVLPLLLPPPAAAQEGLAEAQGALTAGNADAFGRFVLAQEGRPVSLRMTAAPAEGRDFSVRLDAPMLLVNLARPERMQVSLTGGYSLREGAFVMDGVYRLRAEGMQQGILVFVLEPVPGGEVRRLREGGVRRVPL